MASGGRGWVSVESSRTGDRNCKGVRVHGRRRRGCAGPGRVGSDRPEPVFRGTLAAVGKVSRGGRETSSLGGGSLQMLYGKREPRSAHTRRRGAYRPLGEDLEARCLMAIDVGGTAPPVLPNVATVPFGVEMVGGVPSGGAGFSVSNLGDVNLDGFDDFFIGAPSIASVGGNLGAGQRAEQHRLARLRVATGRRRQRRLALARCAATRRRPGPAGQLGEHAAEPLQRQPRVPLRGHPLHHQPERQFAAGSVGLEPGDHQRGPGLPGRCPGRGRRRRRPERGGSGLPDLRRDQPEQRPQHHRRPRHHRRGDLRRHASSRSPPPSPVARRDGRWPASAT